LWTTGWPGRALSPARRTLTTNDAAGGATSRTFQASDAELLRRVQADDLDAFEEFFARYRSSIYRTAYGLTGDRQAAEEILQDTFARAYQRRHSLHPDVSPLPWLHRVSLNLCYSRLSRRRVKTDPINEATESGHADDAPLPSDTAERNELRTIVRDGIAALPEKHRSVVVLYYLQRLSLQETAEVLGIQLGTVKSRLHYALRGLRDHLERDRRFGGAYRAPAGDDVEVNAS
jgi:RNA polymerase sigma-70 factor (ECF subfamily)